MKEEVIAFVKSRLRLAQELLEESDVLPGSEGYFKNKKEWWLHPRHEREALVCYLLLTCFDRLGQKQKYLTFNDWLNSKKKTHEKERNIVIDKMERADDFLGGAKALHEHYQEIYGVKNSFYNGLSNLPKDARKRLLDSIQVRVCPKYGLYGPNVGMPASRLNDSDLKKQLQFKYLYKRRNRFTHNLEQYQRSSKPIMSDMTIFRDLSGQASWVAEIKDSKLTYWCLHHEHELIPGGGAYIFYIQEWPFVLFEVLHAAISQQFHRTSINLRFQVRLKNKVTIQLENRKLT